MRNIVVVTPFYPYPQNERLVKDTNAVYYLTKNKREDENVIIVYYYLHRRKSAYYNLPRILKIDSYHQCLYQDNRGYDVLLFEHPCIFPHLYHTISFFDNKYVSFLNQYLSDRKISIDCLFVHFPIRFTNFAKKIDAARKIAICHSFDVENRKLEETKKNSIFYDTLGFRSPQIRRVYYGRSDSSGCLCLSGVPDNYLDTDYQRISWKKDGILRLCFAGRLVKNKNVENVIWAINKIKNRIQLIFSIIGEGEELSNLKHLVSKLNLGSKILFLGGMSRENVFSEFLQNDVFIMTSFKETLGLVYLEALSAGNLIIASKDRGIDGIIQDNHGVLYVDPDSVDSIANAIEKYFCMESSDVEKLRLEIRHTIIQFSESAVSRSYLDMAYDR